MPPNRAEKRRLARERAKAGRIQISGQIVGRECRFPLIVTPPPGYPYLEQSVTAIVDTGCTKSSVREDIATFLRLPFQGRSQMVTANGPVNCNLVGASLTIKTKTGTVHRTVQLAVPPMAVEMLFGMDALEGGILIVDSVTATWEWNLHQVQLLPRPPG